MRSCDPATGRAPARRGRRRAAPGPEAAARPDADVLLRRLMLDRFTARFTLLPYSVGHHLIACDSLTVTDVTIREHWAQCGTCEFTDLTGHFACQHVQMRWSFDKSGTLGEIIAALADLDDDAVSPAQQAFEPPGDN